MFCILTLYQFTNSLFNGIIYEAYKLRVHMKIALLCGGPSLERGISLNSARSVLDHLESDSIEIIPIYFDYRKRPFLISKSQLYSNTPSDFDFKLHKHAKFLHERALINLLKKTDIVFPVIHGRFGEDGEIQKFLETNNIPYVGSDSLSCKKAFDKFTANEFIRSLGFYAPPSIALENREKDDFEKIRGFFKKNKIKRAIVKPASGGSSIGVFSVGSPKEAIEKKNFIFSKKIDSRAVIEPFCTGIEFTVIILENKAGKPVAILPTEIETDYANHQIFDYRKKYLPSRHVRYHCPPRFDKETIEKIQRQAEQIFGALGMRDFSRFDGWVLKDGKIWFSDFNPVSGMEQNSFLFQQSSRVGLSHKDTLLYIIKRACERQKIPFSVKPAMSAKNKKPVNVLFGGATSERQVSLMTGTNVWLKLRKSKKYAPRPFLLDVNDNVWELPYALTLNHTVEEITQHCEKFAEEEKKLRFFEMQARKKLGLKNFGGEHFFSPKKMSLDEFVENSKFVFIALHGGIGENGELQKLLAQKGVKFNGSSAETSALCMDKWRTAERVKGLKIPGVFSIPQSKFALREFASFKKKDFESTWKSACKELKSKSLIVKPSSDGCSSGIARLISPDELRKYVKLASENVHFIPNGTFKKQNGIIEMPIKKLSGFLLEKFVETDFVSISKSEIKIERKTNWMEITIGVLGKKGAMKAFNPSLTVAEGEILSVEEKFQGGTGINITPPYEVSKKYVVEKVRKKTEKLAAALSMEGYGRFDAFMNTLTSDMIIIEANTLPALTPSTVLFHQALAEKKQIYPLELLEKIVELGGYG